MNKRHALRSLFSLPTLLLVIACIGCQGGTPIENQSDSTGSAPLPQPGAVDDQQRRVDGILVVGSGLTDEHVAAIRRLTDELEPAPANSDSTPIRNITHDSATEATNIWQVGSLQTYQTLQWKNNEWQVVDQGGGLVGGVPAGSSFEDLDSKD